MSQRPVILTLALLLLSACVQQPDPTPEPEPTTGTDRQTSSPSTASTTATGPLGTFRDAPELPSPAEHAQLPPCGATPFTTTPVDLNQVESISPIGNVAPPGHTFPTEHPFLHLNPGGQSQETFPLAAPANVTLTLIYINRGITQDPVDYTLYFACGDIVAYYNHVKEISPALQVLVDAKECRFEHERKDATCHIQTFEPIYEGALMGAVGGLQGNFDFGAMDLRVTHAYANPSRYGSRTTHIMCAFELYSPPTRDRFLALIARDDENSCGDSSQDVPGTLQGNWFHSETTEPISQWDRHLAFVYDNEDPSEAVISIAGHVHEPGTVRFLPRISGTTNRPFANVTPAGTLQCYEGNGIIGKILVEMTSTDAIRIEHQGSACIEANAFATPLEYRR